MKRLIKKENARAGKEDSLRTDPPVEVLDAVGV